MTKIYGYIRISSHDQNEDRERIAMKEAAVPIKHVYMDKQSGKDFNRPSYQKLLRKLREGDILYILSIDRLGRNYEEIQNQWRILTKEKNRHCRHRHAASRHTPREKSSRHVHQRYGAAVIILCSAERT